MIFIRCGGKQIPAILDRAAFLGIADPILVIDNCSIHHDVDFQILMAFNGIRIVFLPPYSPGLNPIEEAFSMFKGWIRRSGKMLRAVGFTATDIIDFAFQSIKPHHAHEWVHHSGYR